MTTPDDRTEERASSLEDRIWARWRWALVAIVLLFVLNNLLGIVAGAAGMLALAHRVTGRVISARRVLDQVQRIASKPEDVTKDVEP